MISAIIPSYKNKSMLLKNIESNLPYLEDCEIIIVNDYPEESLKEDLKDFKKVVLIENKTNLGFGEAVNTGVKKAQGEYLLLLNSDVVLNNDGFKLAVRHFEKNPSLFAVSFAQNERGGVVGKNKIYWDNGLFHHDKSRDLNFGYNGWAEGGAALINKEKFLILEGFSKLYAPFYWEDVDLSYRAWKVGWQIIFEPKISVTHHHESTIGKYFDKSHIKKIAYRNQLIFVWKNITDSPLIFLHLIFLIKKFIRGLFGKNKEFREAFGNAFSKILDIRKERIRAKKSFEKSDREILRLFDD